MSMRNERPFSQYTFLVDLGSGNTLGSDAGFQEVSGIGMELSDTGAVFGRAEVDPTDKKIAMPVEIILKKGAVDPRAFEQWLSDHGHGKQKSQRTVTIMRQNEDRTAIIQTWKLLRARIIKHTSGPMKAKSTDVAIEELVLAYERLVMD